MPGYRPTYLRYGRAFLYALEGRKVGIIDEATDLFTLEAIFSTLTNVDFDPDRFAADQESGRTARKHEGQSCS